MVAAPKPKPKRDPFSGQQTSSAKADNNADVYDRYDNELEKNDVDSADKYDEPSREVLQKKH